MITKDDFKKIDSAWITKIDGTILCIESHEGVWKLYVYGALAEVEKPEENLTDPTDPAWRVLVNQANEIAQIRRIGTDHE